MKIFKTSQVRILDQATIEQEPIASIDLMERAADALYYAYVDKFSNLLPICILSGQGNNGGDALALARKLLKSGYAVSTYLIHSNTLSPDCEINRQRLISEFPNTLYELSSKFIEPKISNNTIIIDGLFGSGLSRPISGIFAEAVNWMNKLEIQIIAIDIPSGLHGEENNLAESSVIVKANLTLSLQFPKLSYMFAENFPYVGNWEVLDIGIHLVAISETPSNLYYLEQNEISVLLKKRLKFAHKGDLGHAFIVAGSKGMAGASVLSSRAALRSGAGLVTVHGPDCNRTILQVANPEVIFKSDKNPDLITAVTNYEKFNALAIGPGIGLETKTKKMLRELLSGLNEPCILDADALNIIGIEKDLLNLIPVNSILTPHPKEFERMFGVYNSSYDRMKKAQEIAQQYQINIVVKGAHTLIAMSDGTLYFNSTGNSGMATAGSGDVLTGILAGLLAQGYSPSDAAKIGVYVHGLAGDMALKKESPESLIAGDIIKNLGKAFKYKKI